MWTSSVLFLTLASPPPAFPNGDLNGDGTADLSDAVLLLQALYMGGAPPTPPMVTEAREPVDDPCPGALAAAEEDLAAARAEAEGLRAELAACRVIPPPVPAGAVVVLSGPEPFAESDSTCISYWQGVFAGGGYQAAAGGPFFLYATATFNTTSYDSFEGNCLSPRVASASYVIRPRGRVLALHVRAGAHSWAEASVTVTDLAIGEGLGRVDAQQPELMTSPEVYSSEIDHSEMAVERSLFLREVDPAHEYSVELHAEAQAMEGGPQAFIAIEFIGGVAP